MNARRAALSVLLWAVVPLWVLSRAEGRVLGRFSVDLAGHLWTYWSASRGPDLRSPWIGFPEGVDLLPVLGGWLDVVLVGGLSAWIGLVPAYNAVMALYVWVLGLGGAACARALGASAGGAALAGLVLQLDPFPMMHLAGGRPEQVGLGFAALALGLAGQVWRGRAPPWSAAVAGALLLTVSWELSLLVALSLAWLLPWLPREGVEAGAGRRWVRAAVGCAVLAGPWVGLFLSRAGQLRALDEGVFAEETAWRASVGLLGWFGAASTRPATLGLLALVGLPWLLPRGERRLGVGLLLGLVVTLLLATGPAPGVWAPAALPGPSWAPFSAFQGFPVLGWFHWPDRLLCVWSIVSAASVGVCFDRVGIYTTRRKILSVFYCVAVVFFAARFLLAGDLPPRGEYELPARRAAVELGWRPEQAAVLDLPIQPDRAQHLSYQLEQLAHGRPVLFNMVLSHLADPGLEQVVQQEPLLAWFAALMGPRAPDARVFTPADLAGLRARGFGFVVLHKRGWPAARWRRGYEALHQSLGDPLLRDRDEWICWSLPPAELPHPPEPLVGAAP